MDITMLKCPVCPHCGVENVAFQMLSQFTEGEFAPKSYQLWVCGHCGKPACSHTPFPLEGHGYIIKDISGFYPIPKEVTAPYGVPAEMSKTFRSAIRFLKMGKDADYEAACVMARRGIELAVNDMGAEGKNLYQKIENLEKRRLVPPAMCDWAQCLREIGNIGAHVGEATREDAEQAVYFAEMLFVYLYTLPKQTAERRKKT